MFFRSLQAVGFALLASLAIGLVPLAGGMAGAVQAAQAAQSAQTHQADQTADVLPLPPLKARVTDLTGTLSQRQRDALEARLAALETAKGAQVAVLLAPTFQPESIEQYGIRLAEAWKLGRKGVDDGVILLIAQDDRQMRIEVGYGLEGALNDATAKRIISEVIMPHFQAGNYYAGIDAGVNAIQAVIEGEPLPAPQASGSRGDTGDTSQFLPLLAVAAVLAQGLNRLLGLGGSLLAAAGVVVIAGWLLGSWAGGLFLGFLVLIFSFMRGGHGMGGMGRGGVGGFGGGGFGGGGGGFGGGGASGRW
ncbi:MAG: TPM domain-containing protein [Rugosibacter sp.]|jgi:uncharacterized protein|nr:uncharacterized protein [Rugosibacter sp.]